MPARNVARAVGRRVGNQSGEDLAHFADGILWTTVGQEAGEAEIADRLNDLTGVVTVDRPALTDSTAAGTTLARVLARRRVLLIVDDGAEPGVLVQAAAGGVLGEHSGLDGPDPGRFAGGDQGVEQGLAGVSALCGRVDVYGVFDEPGIYGPGGDRGHRYSADHRADVVYGDVAVSGSLPVSKAGQAGAAVSKLAWPASKPAW